MEVLVTDPGSTKSGTCPDCAAKNGKPISETGRPPLHPNCACEVRTVERETQPGKVLDENFVGMQPAQFWNEEPEQGGVDFFSDDKPTKPRKTKKPDFFEETAPIEEPPEEPKEDFFGQADNLWDQTPKRRKKDFFGQPSQQMESFFD